MKAKTIMKGEFLCYRQERHEKNRGEKELPPKIQKKVNGKRRKKMGDRERYLEMKGPRGKRAGTFKKDVGIWE